jgi:hypothetical protein
MTVRGSQWLLAGLLGATLCTGCQGVSPAALAYFLLPESKEPAEYRRLPPGDKKKTNRVAILTVATLQTQTEFIQVDRELSQLLADQLEAACKENDDHIHIIPPGDVEEFKNRTPDWKSLSTAEIGRALRADYVIVLDLGKMTLYQQGSHDTLMQGHAELSIALVDVAHPDTVGKGKELSYTYPSDARGSIPVDADMPPQQFSQQFLAHLAKRLSFSFVPHTKHDRLLMQSMND